MSRIGEIVNMVKFEYKRYWVYKNFVGFKINESGDGVTGAIGVDKPNIKHHLPDIFYENPL